MTDLPPLAPGTLAGLAVGSATLASMIIPVPVWRRSALSGVLLLGLALASHRRVGDDSAAGTAVAGITLGIGLLGVGVLAAALVLSFFSAGQRSAAGWWAGLLGLVGAAAGTGQLLPPGASGGWPIAMATAVSLAGIAVLAGNLGRRLRFREGVRTLDRVLSPPSGAPVRPTWDRWSSRLLTVHVLGAAVALGALQLPVLMGAVALSAFAGLLLERRTGRMGRLPVVFILAVMVLVVMWVLLAWVAGEMPHGLLALRDAPYSPAFETLTALPLALVAWSFLGLWPFHMSIRGPVTSLLGAALMVRLLGPVLPYGFEHWQPILYPLAVVAAWHGALVTRDAEILAALGALGLLSGDPMAGWAGVAFAGVGAVLDANCRLGEWGHGLNQRGRVAVAGSLVLAAILLVPVLSGALGAEVFYSVLAVAGASAVCIGGDGRRETGDGRRKTGDWSRDAERILPGNLWPSRDSQGR